MAVTGTNTENQRMKFVADEIEAKTSLTVNGSPITGAAPNAADIPFSSQNFSAQNVADALEELYATLNP